MNIRFSTLLAVLVAAPIAAPAQGAPPAAPAASGAPIAPVAPGPGTAPVGGPARHHGGYLRALRGLDLSSDQRSKIQTIVASGRAKNQGVTDRATRHANQQAMRHSLDAVLTPAQRSQLQTNLAAMRAEARSGAAAPVEPGATAAP